MEYLGIDWSYRRAAWCSLSDAGVIVGEGAVPADADGLARLVIERGVDVRAVVEMMSGAVWVRDQLAAAGWRVQIAHARKVRDVAPLACKTDKVDARVLAELARRDLVPELWVPPLEDRERLRRRTHLVRMRASAMNRIFGLQTQWGLRISLRRLRAQSGDRSRTGALSKAGSRTLRWAAVEAAQHAWRPSNPWHQLYSDLAQRAGKNPAKAAVARKILIAAWHVLSRQQPFKPAAPRRPDPLSASSRCFLAA